MRGKPLIAALLVGPMVLALCNVSMAGVGTAAPAPRLFEQHAPRLPAPLLQVSKARYGLSGSVAISADSLPMLARWRSAMNDNCNREDVACSALAPAASIVARHSRNLSPEAKLRLVNWTVNTAVVYRPDIWGSDNWASPAETLSTGRGDCEDYAIAKRWLLRRLGFADEQLQMVVLEDRRRGLMHAVLAVHLGERTFFLDNLSKDIFLDGDNPDYVPMVSFAGSHAFVHGFKEPAVTLASLR